jgi:hypothetical protein
MMFLDLMLVVCGFAVAAVMLVRSCMSQASTQFAGHMIC